jgi:aspartate aminotransferase
VNNLPAETALRIPASGIREIADKAMERPGTIRLEMGEPNFPTPSHITDAACQAIAAGKTRYTATSGIRPLRELLTEKLKRVNGISALPENVVVTAGGVNAIYASFAALLNPLDEVLVPNPGWPNYAMQVIGCGGRVREYPLNPNTFLPDLETISSLISERTKVLIVNSPGNPTGAAIPQRLTEQLVELAARHNIYILSDEVYDELVYDARHTSLYNLAPTRVIGVYSFSKTYAMTGWRLGYLVANTDLARTIERVQESIVSCASHVSQEAGVAALSGNQSVVSAMRDIYRARRDSVVAELQKNGLYTYTPQGAFYTLVDVSAARLPSREFALKLLDEEGVSVAPGSAFGSAANHTVRISLASSEEDLHAGVAAISRLITQVQSKLS